MKKTKVTIIKIGTGVLTRESDGRLDSASLVKLVTAVAEVSSQGNRCILVSSGAVGAGISDIGLKEYPEDIATRQACSAIGQTHLMHTYQDLFSQFGMVVAQLLLTAEDFKQKARVDTMLSAMDKLLEIPNCIPIINENDLIAVEELSMGDNDMLSANVASLLGAERLILLTSVDGLIPPDGNGIVNEVEDISEVLEFARDDSGKFSIGGMKLTVETLKIFQLLLMEKA